MLNLNNAGPVEALDEIAKLPGLTVRHEPLETNRVKFDLGFSFAESHSTGGTPGGLRGALQYRTDLFDRVSARGIVDRFVRVLGELAADPGRSVGDVEVLDVAERERVLVGWNGEIRGLGVCRCRCCSRSRWSGLRMRWRWCVGAVFDVWGVGSLVESCGALVDRSGVGAESFVGVMLPRSVELVVALLGVVKAGVRMCRWMWSIRRSVWRRFLVMRARSW